MVFLPAETPLILTKFCLYPAANYFENLIPKPNWVISTAKRKLLSQAQSKFSDSWHISFTKYFNRGTNLSIMVVFPSSDKSLEAI